MGLATTNNNPGNLRDVKTSQFRKFNSPDDGYAALMNDLQAKVTGATSTGLHSGSTLYDFSQAYAPRTDKNNPENYTTQLANQMGVRPDTKLSDLKDRIPEFAYAVANNEDGEFAKAHPLSFPKYQSQTVDTQTQTPQPEESFGSKVLSGAKSLARGIGGSFYDPAVQMGTEVANRVLGPAVNAMGGDYEQVKSLPSFANITGDENAPRITAPGYDENGMPVSGWKEAEKLTGDVGMTALNLYTGGIGGTALKAGESVGKYALGRAGEGMFKTGLRETPLWAAYGGSEAMSKGGDAVDVAGGVGTGAVGGFVGGSLLKGASMGISKLKEINANLLDEAINLKSQGKTDEANAIINSDKFKTFMKSNGLDDANIDTHISAIKNELKIFENNGIDRSSGSAQGKRNLQQEKTQESSRDSWIKYSAPAGRDGNPFDPTQINIENTRKIIGNNSSDVIEAARKSKAEFVPLDVQKVIKSVRTEAYNNGLQGSQLNSAIDRITEDLLAREKQALLQKRKLDISDFYNLKQEANKTYGGDSFGAQLSTSVGNVLRRQLDNAVKNTEDSASQRVVTFLRNSDHTYKELKDAEAYNKFLQGFPGGKPSKLINLMAGYGLGGGPLGGIAMMFAMDKLQQRVINSRSRGMLGSLAGKVKSMPTAELMGQAQKIIKDIQTKGTERVADRRMAKTLTDITRNKAKATSDEAKRNVDRLKGNPVPFNNKYTPESKMPVIDMGDTPVSKYNKSDSKLPTIRGMATPNTLNAMATLSGLTGLGALAQKKYGTDTYTREEEPKEEPFMKPVVNEHILSPKEEEAAKSVPASMIGTIKKAMEHTGINLDKVINHMKAENGGKWDPNLVGNADPTDRGVTQLNPIAIGILEGTTGPKVDFFQQNFGHKFDINNVDDQILGYATYMNWLKQYALPEQGIKNPTNNDAMLAYNLGAKGLSEIKNKTADATTTARYARYYSLLKQNDALD